MARAMSSRSSKVLGVRSASTSRACASSPSNGVGLAAAVVSWSKKQATARAAKRRRADANMWCQRAKSKFSSSQPPRETGCIYTSQPQARTTTIPKSICRCQTRHAGPGVPANAVSARSALQLVCDHVPPTYPPQGRRGGTRDGSATGSAYHIWAARAVVQPVVQPACRVVAAPSTELDRQMSSVSHGSQRETQRHPIRET